MRKSVLILGASGRFGRHAAEAFWNAGWSIRAFDRARDDLERSAEGAEVIVAAWNPLYPNWAEQVPALHARILKAARNSGATVLLPGNVYVYGAQTPAPWGADTPHNATNPLGRIRVDMEQSYRDSGVQTILLRAGDFIDTEASGNWLDKVMLPGLRKDRFIYPGRTNASHAWAYLPDLARAAVALVEMRTDLGQFEDIPFPGFTLTGSEIANALSDIAGRRIRTRQMSWLPLHLARPFWAMAGCLIEMRYLWDTPHRIDRDRFDSLLPGFLDTPLEDALAKAAAPWFKDYSTNRAASQSIIRSTQTSL